MNALLICLGLMSGDLLPPATGPDFQYTGSSNTNEQLFKVYFDPQPLPAMDVYPGKYSVSNEERKRLRRDSADLWLGIRILQSKHPAKSLIPLERAANNMKNTVSNASEWYLALAYLRLGKTPQAEYLFHKIAETEIHPYQDHAEVVYQRLVKRDNR